MARAFLMAMVAAFGLLWSSTGIARTDEPPELTLQQLRDKYALPDSRYIDLDGVSIHYVDEGSGTPVVLLHASYLNLDSWRAVAAALKGKYRVIRFDFPSQGLSGYETKPVPKGGYDLTDRNAQILGLLVNALHLDRFDLVGTSSGGTVAFHYAADHPQRVARLVLINSAGLPRTPQTDPLRAKLQFAKWMDMKVKPRAFWALALKETFIPPHKVPDWLLDEEYDFHRRVGMDAATADYHYHTGDARAVLERVAAPTFIMWGKADPIVMHLQGDIFEYWMSGAPTLLRKYPGLGHYPFISDPQAILPDLEAFLGGQLDNQLRLSARVLPARK